MRFRASHIACLLVLLSSLGTAQATVRPASSGVLGGQSFGLLLAHVQHEAREQTAPFDRAEQRTQVALPVSGQATHRIAWTMRPPSQDAAAVYATTSFGR